MGDYASVAFADLDQDGDEDAFIGNGSIGTIAYLENDGKNNFVEILGVNVPFASIDVGTYSTPAFFDLNKDGHLDGFAGNSSGQINYLNNPLSGIDVGSYASPTFVDLDNDGDGDTVVGNRDGGIIYFRNEGNGNFTQLLGAANPFFSVNVGSYAAPTFADVNNDGHLDATIGNSDGTLSYYRNNGNGTFAKLIGANNPFNLVDIGSYSAPVFADLDKDGDQDLFIGESDGTINYYKNNNGTFALIVGSANPFTTVDVGSYSRLSFADLDEDGDLDAFIGNSDGLIKYFENDGNNIFTELLNSSNPFNSLDVGSYSVPSFADLDQDGDKDAFIGNSDGAIYFYENISSVTLNGNASNNILIGKSGDDLLNGKGGNDRLTGKAGDDTLNGGDGSDRLVESANVDFILGNTKLIGQGTDRLISIETATLTGGEGNNLINASAFTKGSVILNGAGGDDILYGGSKKDNIKGGAGDDILYGNQGKDDLFGGTGKDIFVLQPGKGQDTFKDFENGVDKIGLPRGVRFIDLTVSGSGVNTIISNSNGVLATLTGVSSTLINGSDFVNWSSYS